MIFGILTLITALSISAVAIYYSVAGLVAIFAAAAVPIMIMGGTLEIAKLVTAVWLHRYWKQATWWLKTYLSTAVVVLMLITSMGIFGFLSKAHIEQTSATQESVARVEQIDTEIGRQRGIVVRAEEKITQLESSGTGADANIQAQIDKEQERIDRAFERIQPAISQQNKIIEDARAADGTRTKPFEDQLTNIQAEILRLESSAREYETSITNLEVDNSAVEPLLDQIAALEAEIIRVTNQLNSREQQQIRAAQAIIGVTSDGLFGSNTRTALATWVEGQRTRITQIQGEVAQVRRNANGEVVAERERLAGVVKDIRERQIPALKTRELDMLNRIDEIRQTESPAIATARDEIQRLRASAESQVAQSQALIQRLRTQLAQTDKADEIDAQVDEQNARIREANNQIDTLTEEKYALEAEYRKLEAEVGPVKYIAEFVYGEQAGADLLEEAVRWVIIIIIFVFDPLAVLLLIASQYTFEYRKKKLEDDSGERLRLERQEYEKLRAQKINDNPGFNINDPAPPQEEEKVDDLRPVETDVISELDRADDNGGDTSSGMALAGKELDEYVHSYTPTDNTTADDDLGDVLSKDDIANLYAPTNTMEQPEVQVDEEQSEVVEKKDSESSEESKIIPKTVNRMFYPEELEEERRKAEYEAKEADVTLQNRKTEWKQAHPDQTVKFYKQLYINGKIDKLPWEEGWKEAESIYSQNSEQNESTLFNKIKNR